MQHSTKSAPLSPLSSSCRSSRDTSVSCMPSYSCIRIILSEVLVGKLPSLACRFAAAHRDCRNTQHLRSCSILLLQKQPVLPCLQVLRRHLVNGLRQVQHLRSRKSNRTCYTGTPFNCTGLLQWDPSGTAPAEKKGRRCSFSFWPRYCI